MFWLKYIGESMKRIFSILLVLASFTFMNAYSGDWPEWRGPNRTDISDETGLLQKWPEEGPKLLWSFEEAGMGYAGVSTDQGKLFTMGARNDRSELICLDTEKGKELWKVDMGGVFVNNWGDGPRSTPTVDGKFVYAMSSKGDLVCVEIKKGKLKWRTSMEKFGGAVPRWGYAESVLVDGDQVIATPGGNKGAIIALNKKTGKLIWQTKSFTDGAQYSSCIKVNHNNVDQYIQLTMKTVVGVNCKTGNILWRTKWPGKMAVIPTPIFQDGHVYISSGYEVGCALFKIGKENKIEEIYYNKNMINHHGGVILYEDHLYGFSDRKGWVCQNFKSGEIVWKEKSRDHGKGAISYADGRFYCFCEKDGTVVLIEASSKGWSEQGRLKFPKFTKKRKPAGKLWMHPVISNGKMYIRDQELLFCYDVKAEK